MSTMLRASFGLGLLLPALGAGCSSDGASGSADAGTGGAGGAPSSAGAGNGGFQSSNGGTGHSGTSTATGGTTAMAGSDNGGGNANAGASGSVGTGGGATGGGGGSAVGGSAGKGGTSSGGTSSGGTSSGGTSSGGTSSGGASNGGHASGGKPNGGAGGGGAPSTCLSSPLLTAIGKSTVLVGASMSDATAKAAPFDLRYEYLSGGIFDGTSACQRCDTGCTAKGVTCANSGPGCAWWGCWQYDQDPPGAYARGFFATDKNNGQIPMITYYQALQASGAGEGAAEVTAMNDGAFVARYLTDFRFLVDQIGQATVFLHIEPDFWGYAEQVNQDPHAIKAAVSSYSGCSAFENSTAGLGRCMIDIAHKNAPNAKVGLHGSGWATKMDVLANKNASFDVAGEAKKLGAFLTACGAGDSDFVVVDASDRDAAWYDTQGRATWWDATNATLPNFHQAFAWARALAESVGKPIVWWQLPVGNSTMPNTAQKWKDNRVEYFLSHADEVAAAHGVAMAFGAGDGNQTTPETDGGYLVSRVKQYASAGRTKGCP